MRTLSRRFLLLCLAGLAPVAAIWRTSAAQVDVNEMGPNNQHMIFWRIQQRDHDAVVAFLDAGVDPNIRGFNGMTPAMWAASSDAWTFVELLASRGADLSLVARNGATVAKTVERADRLQRVRAGSEQAQALDRVRARMVALGLME